MENERRQFDIRCPIHGFVKLSAWEREIINHPAYQRLRRIRQLAWTDYVYPGAMHTRFEHSLGVMHVATLLYDAIGRNSKEVLEQDTALNRMISDGMSNSFAWLLSCMILDIPPSRTRLRSYSRKKKGSRANATNTKNTRSPSSWVRSPMSLTPTQTTGI